MAPAVKRSPGRPPVPGLAARRREEILDRATQVFAAQGFFRADVQEIADSLGIGKGTVYRYFPTKEKLFLAAVDRGMNLLSTHVKSDAADALDPLDRIARAIRSFLAFFDSHPPIIELLVQERAEFRHRTKPTYFEHRDANLGPWRELFRDLIAKGRIRRIPIERITDVLSDLLYGAVFTSHFARRRKSLEEQARDILDVVFHGIVGGHQ